MAIFVTGSTGYLGSYLVAGLLTGHRDMLNLLVRAKSDQEARERLWTSLQLHLDFHEFAEFLNSRVRIFRGDLTAECFGLSDDVYHALVDTTDSLIHCAASLNRKSERQCLNVNLRGTLEVIQLARRAQNRNGLRRYSHVSTVAVAGKRKNEVVTEDAAIDWWDYWINVHIPALRRWCYPLMEGRPLESREPRALDWTAEPAREPALSKAAAPSDPLWRSS